MKIRNFKASVGGVERLVVGLKLDGFTAIFDDPASMDRFFAYVVQRYGDFARLQRRAALAGEWVLAPIQGATPPVQEVGQ